MMKNLPRVTAAEAIKVLEGAGFVLARQSGRHKIYKPVGQEGDGASSYWENTPSQGFSQYLEGC